jgi:hypothetical protein
VLIANPAVAAMIREGKTQQIPSLMQIGGKAGCRLLNDALLDLVRNGLVDASEAYLKCIAKDDFLKQCQVDGIKVELPSIENPDAHGAPKSGSGARPSGSMPSIENPRAPLPQSPGSKPAAPALRPAPSAPQQGGTGSIFDKFKRS